MIDAFLDSWHLFGDTYLAAWLMAVVLALAGLPFVIRDQIFVGVAIAQSSMLGIGLALWLGASISWLQTAPGLTLLAIVFAIGTMLLTSSGDTRGTTAEGRTGWVYLLAGSLVLVVLANSPLGLNQLNHLAASSLIGATRTEAILLAVVLLLLVLLAIWRRDALLLLLTDRPQARAVGLRVRLWEVGLALVLGAVIGLCLRIGGLLYTFGALVLPGLAACKLCRELRALLWVAPCLALAGAVAGFVAGNHWDLPPAALTVALLAILMIPAKLVGHWRRRRLA